jgi:hypothetical protein
MNSSARRWAILLILILVVCGQLIAGEPETKKPFLKWIGPAGGYNPDGGGLFHWWNPGCFPWCGGPDDYHRKPMVHYCWPAPPEPWVYPAVPPAGQAPSKDEKPKDKKDKSADKKDKIDKPADQSR